MSTTRPKPRRIWRQLFYSFGGLLAFSAFIGVQVVYFTDYFRSGESIHINLRYQQPMLLSSMLVIAVLGDIVLAGMGVRAIVRWWRSRESTR